MVSKWVGDYFNISLYDLHVEVMHVPYVECQPPTAMMHLPAGATMSSPAICFSAVSQVREIYDTLSSCKHNGFPITQNDNGDGTPLIGLMLRNQVRVILTVRPAHPESWSRVIGLPACSISVRSSET